MENSENTVLSRFPRPERRRSPRYEAHVAVEIERPERRHVAVTRDLSSGGVQVLARTRFSVGDTIRMRICFPYEPASPQEVTGRVVRVHDVSVQESDVWEYRIAVQLDE